MRLAYRFHKVRRGLARYGLRRTASGLRRLIDYRVRQPLDGVIYTHCDDLAVHFQYPRQFMPTLALFGELVEPEYQLIRRVVAGGRSVVFDVGGGIGTYALTAAHHGARVVHVFEPTGEGHAAIVRNLKKNGLAERVIVNRAAVSDTRGTLLMHRQASLFIGRVDSEPAGLETGQKSGQKSHEEAVPAISLDEYCEERDIAHIDILKVDVEGHETQVVHGARRLLARGAIDLVILEVDASRAALYRSLAANGYRAYFYDDDRHALVPVEPITEQRVRTLKPRGFHCNIVFVRSGALADLDRTLAIRQPG